MRVPKESRDDADLRPGRYSLQLTIQNLTTGETATRSTDLLVVERTGT